MGAEKLLSPVKSLRLLHLLLTVTLAVGTFILSVRHLSRINGLWQHQTSSISESREKTRIASGYWRNLPNQLSEYGDGTSVSDTGKIKWKTFVWYYTPMWLRQKSSEYLFDRCEVSQCKISYDSRDIPTSDGVIVPSKEIDEGQPPFLRPGQILIFFNLEPPVYLNVSDVWRHAFHWTFTYRHASDIWRPYGQLKSHLQYPTLQQLKGVVKKKTKAVAWFVSRCRSQSKRENYAAELSKYIPIDIYGRCGTLECGADCYKKLTPYRFFLAFENSLCSEYVTEKFFKTFDHDVIPIVRGGANYSEMYGDDLFINTADFSSAKALAKYLKYLMDHDDEYVRILHKRRQFYPGFRTPWCELCRKMHTTTKINKTYDILTWLDPGSCKAPTDLN